MTFKIKLRGDGSAPILADFRCELHGVFEATVPRDNSDEAPCPRDGCSRWSPWTASIVFGKVKPASATQGGWAKPPTPGCLDTRELAEGMPYDEWKAKRAKIRDEQRRREIKEMLND